MKLASRYVPEILEQVKSRSGTSRYTFSRDLFDEYINLPFSDRTGVHKSQLLVLLLEDGTLESCSEDREYQTFFVAATMRFMRLDQHEGYSGLGIDIEDCLWKLSKYPADRQSREFANFCSEFAAALQPYIEASGPNYRMAHIVLPLSTTRSSSRPGAVGPGMNAIRKTIADILCKKKPLYDTAHQVGSSTGELSITSFVDFLANIRSRSEDFFRIVLGAYITRSSWDTESVLQEVSKVEALTRSARRVVSPPAR